MLTNLFQGERICFTADEPEALGKAFARWGRDSEYMHLLDTEQPVLFSAKKTQSWFEEDLGKDTPPGYFFNIHLRAEGAQRLIGFVGLWGIDWNHGDGWVSIGIGERDCWGQGYGTEAMRMLLRYAFSELGLFRVTLGVFAFNERARRSYEKCGFRVEGAQRGMLLRSGQRRDVYVMGVLRDEFLATQPGISSQPGTLVPGTPNDPGAPNVPAATTAP